MRPRPPPWRGARSNAAPLRACASPGGPTAGPGCRDGSLPRRGGISALGREGVILAGTSRGPRGMRLALVRKGHSLPQGPWKAVPVRESVFQPPRPRSGRAGRHREAVLSQHRWKRSPGTAAWGVEEGRAPQLRRLGKPGRTFLSKTILLIKMKTSKVTEDIYPTRSGEWEV